MSTFVQADPSAKPIHSIENLRGYFQNFAKPAGQERIGLEYELFGVHAETGEALPYSGPLGIEAILNELAYEFGYEPIQEDGHTVALQKGSTFISLEPGGQVELSAEPVASVHEVKAQLDEFLFELKTIARFMGSVAWIAFGIHPFSNLRQIPWVPKRRYQIMAHYLGRRGKKAHDMMKRTATNQVNFDYLSEEDAIEKMRLVLALTPIAAAMFANSSISLGRSNGLQSERLKIWRHTDPDRAGMILNLICQNCSFQDYLNFVLDVPMMFLVRGCEWIALRNLTFRKFIQEGHRGFQATQSDFELHLSTIFTDARFKQYLEVRGMDGQRSHLVPAVAAFWKGILYDADARRLSERFVRRFRESELLRLHQSVERSGLKARVHREPVLELARELVRISEKGLSRQHKFNQEEQDERVYLIPLKEEILRTGKTQAEQTAKLWEGQFKRSRKALIDYLKI